MTGTDALQAAVMLAAIRVEAERRLDDGLSLGEVLGWVEDQPGLTDETYAKLETSLSDRRV